MSAIIFLKKRLWENSWAVDVGESTLGCSENSGLFLKAMTQVIAQETHRVYFYDRNFYAFAAVTKEKIVSWKQTQGYVYDT